MKHNWKHIKFGDAFNLQMGKTPARANSAYWSNGLYDWVSISDMPNGKYIQGTKEKISQKAVDETGIHLVKKGTALMSFKLTIGKTAIAPYDLYTNEAIMAFEPKEGIDVLADFLYYYLQLYKWTGNRAVMGNTTNKGVIANSYASIPSLDEQQAIVRELDGINRLIDLQEEQLREYDNLAQSLFYTTFGDPVSNPKGWEVKKLGEVATSELGKTLNQSKDTGVLRPYLCAINILWGEINIKTLKEARFGDSEVERYSVRKGDLLVCEGGETGRAAIWKDDEPMLYQNALHRVRFENSIVNTYALFWLQMLKQKGEIDAKYSKGVTIKHLVKSALLSIPIMCPPLVLQQTFAAQIEAIEQQKALIRRSLDDIRTLLAARMQYYFE